jgi:hypothetical protein
MSKPKKTKEEIQKKVDSWFCPINPMAQVIEHYYNMRKKNG